MKSNYYEVQWDEKCKTAYVKANDKETVDSQMTILYGTPSRPFIIKESLNCKENWIDHDFTNLDK